MPANRTSSTGRPGKRSDALERVAMSAAGVCAALDASPPQGALGAMHRQLAGALEDLSRCRGRATDADTPPRPVPPPDAKDARGYLLAASSRPGAGAGRVPRNKGRAYPADPPSTAEIVELMRGCPDTVHGRRLKALIAFLWRTGLRISEALNVMEGDLDVRAGSVVVRRGKGGKRRIVGMDPFGWDMVAPWLEERRHYPAGPIFCVLSGPTAGTRSWAYPDVAKQLRGLGRSCGIRRRIAAHQLRHALAVEMAREGCAVHLISRHLGHANVGITSIYLQGVSNQEVVDMAAERRPPTLTVPDLMGTLRAA